MLLFQPWKIILVVAVCLIGLVLALPNLASRETAAGLPGWLPSQQISLGLDLQGGSHLLLEVDTGAVIRERLEDILQSVRANLREKRIGYAGLGISGTSVRVRVRKVDEQAKALEALDELSTQMQPGLFGGGGGADILIEGGEEGAITLTLSEQAIEERKKSAVTQSIEIVRRRIDETGTREPTIQRQGDERILIQLPGVDDPDRIKRLLGKTAKMVFRLVDVNTSPAEAERGRVPPGSELLLSDKETDGTGAPLKFVVRKRVMVSGENLIDAQATYQDGRPVVNFRFDSVGAKRFGDATRKNVGRPFAIVLDGHVISAPVIREAILGGSGVISGGFTAQEVNDLALLLRAGALPAPLKILEERSVGPSLGADSVRAGKIASALGFALVIVFMFLAYGLFGLAANVALVTNMVLIAGVLSVFQASLTLPGIAGIVLTIGMAVDANVLVFERIREEVGVGKTPFAAVDAGYRRALTTIIDANVTTLIAAVLLFQFGSGPVKGFAVTLAVGIATSMFTAVMLTRLLIVLWLRRARPTALPI
jgi:preprotein translocase subunit SecD